MSFQMLWPLLLVVGANTMYQICAKSMPGELNPFAGLVVTYLTSAVFCLVLFFLFRGGSLSQEFQKINWTPFVLGMSIVGLEAGFIQMYKVGWLVNTASLVQSILLAIALLVVGFFLFQEAITPIKLVGILVCLVGIFLMNW